jgi:hypothetical protein
MNPKQSLTRLSEVVQILDGGPPPGRVFAAAAGAREYARGVTGNDLAPDHLLALHEAGITTVEEVVALGTLPKAAQLFKGLGIKKAAVDKLQKVFAASAAGKEELADWTRFGQYRYSTGFRFDPRKPPKEPAATEAELAAVGAPVTGAPPAPSVNLINQYMSRIRNQANRGTCVGFTAAACMEYYWNRFHGQLQLDLSEQFIYWNMVDQSGQHSLAACYPLLVKTGACREVRWPYNPNPINNNDSQGPAPAAALQEAPAYRCKQVRQIANPRSVSSIKRALNNEHVVGIGIPVFNSWYASPVVRKYGNITVPLPGEQPQPIGHAVALVGYEDNAEFAGGGYFIVRNSWGILWATQSALGAGYGTIPYRYIRTQNWDAWYVRS